MIDLTSDLPRFLIVEGRSFPVHTDYRVWIEVGEMIRQGCSLHDLTFIFEGDIPDEDYSEALYEFYASENPTPKVSGSDGERFFDYLMDGEYIYASFMQAYQIDLVDIPYLHYHKFKALFSSLPEETKMSRIISLRSYDPVEERKRPEQVRARLKDVWSLPTDENEKQDFLQQMNELFYNA